MYKHNILIRNDEIYDLNYDFQNTLQFGSGCLSIEIISTSVREYKKLGVSGRRMMLKFKNPDNVNLNDWSHAAMNDLLRLVEVEMKIEPQDRVGFTFSNTENHKIDFNISFRRFDQYTSESILFALDSVLQSNTNFFLDDTLIVNVDHVRIPTGNGRRVCIGKSSVDYYKIHRNSIFNPNIKPEDGNICLSVAILIGKVYADGDISQNLFNYLIYPPNHSDMINEARLFASEAGVSLENGGCIDEIVKFQYHLRNEYNLTVYSSRDGRNVYYKSPYKNNKHINLLLDNGHFSVIKSLTAAFASSYFCNYCAEPYSTRMNHKNCPFKCNRCYESPPCENALHINCPDCNRTFVNARCFQNHLKNNICLKVRICLKCTKCYSYDKKKKHVCGIKYCYICKAEKAVRHECFIPIVAPKTPKFNKELYVFFDLECSQTEHFPGDERKFLHKPNLCVVQQSCDSCADISDVSQSCANCFTREHVFYGGDVIDKFMNYLGSISDKFKKIIIIAHNLQKYDGHFLLQYMYSASDTWLLKENSLIINGSKILQIKVGRYRFIDSLNFFSVALSKLPDMFKLNCNAKGYYPHFFNTEQNSNYIGCFPDMKYYGVGNMRAKERKKFIEWYETQVRNNQIFDNKAELIKYCKQDVNILRNACLKFMSMLMDLTDINPFYQITIAGTCMTIFKSAFLEENQIAIIPNNGYRLRENQSIKALKWLSWLEHSQNIQIISSLNGREMRIAYDIVVDGFHNDTVYEFLGCYWHQCQKCFPLQHHTSPENRKSKLRSLYESTLFRSEKIKNLGYNLVQIWEHDFDAMVAANPMIKQYLSTVEHLHFEPLNPRDAFFGGRTGVCKLYHKIEKDEKILYYDVTSLYPYINKYANYPIGIPKILIGNLLENRTVFNIDGIIKCRVLPPRRLYHPVLPIKMHHKLLFLLCYQCGLDKHNGDCHHSNEQRAFDSTYIAEELRVAVNKGYEILKIYEAWEYEMTKYDPTTKTGGIFVQYIDTFLKIKTEASGYPSWCKTETDKDNYIASFQSHEGIELERENIAKNHGLRSLAKLCLNSIWGKFGERPDKIKKSFVNNQNDLLGLLTNPSNDVQSFYGLSDDAILVSYKLLDDANMKQSNVNVAIAAYTTAHARLHLYKYLDALGENVLYYDTDSVFFIKRQNEPGLPLGDYLGDLTDELIEFGENSFIEEVVFTSEKSYAFKVNCNTNISSEEKPPCVVKVKGITLNHESSKFINFDAMKTLVFTQEFSEQNIIRLNTNVILRTGCSHVYSTAKEYSFKVNATKRRKVGENQIFTLPFGYTCDIDDGDENSI